MLGPDSRALLQGIFPAPYTLIYTILTNMYTCIFVSERSMCVCRLLTLSVETRSLGFYLDLTD